MAFLTKESKNPEKQIRQNQADDVQGEFFVNGKNSIH